MNRFAKQAKLLNKNLCFKSDGGHAISRQEKRRLPKSTARFPQRKDGILHPPPFPVGLSWDSSSLPQNLCGCTFADVTTKFSRINRLPNLLSNQFSAAHCVGGLRFAVSMVLRYEAKVFSKFLRMSTPNFSPRQ